jgi:hypothetical protein
MKNRFIYLIIIAFSLFLGCKKESVELPDGLVNAKANLENEFESINQKMASAVVSIISTGADSALVRARLLELVYGTTDITDFAWVTPSGIMQIIEPSIYYGSQGTNISSQDHVVKAFATKSPVLSGQFLSKEGFYAAAVIHPVVANNSVLGAISALFFPEQILENVMKPLFEGQEFELWVMEKGGKILYDQDAAEIGRELFSDPLYAGFPELLTAGHKIADEESGRTSYSFYKTGTKETVTKETYWNTFVLYGTEWKVVWVRPEL